MNVKFLNPFVESTFEVLKIESGIAAERGELSLEKTPYTTQDVTVIIGLVGSVQGTVFYGMDSSTALGIVSSMIGDNIPELNNLAQSGIAELGNVITGRASVKLSQAGYESTISPPSLLIGAHATISTLDFGRLVVPIITDFGTILIHLALRESADDHRKTAQIPVPSRPILP
jgi:chemotaxis protein CheX